MDQQLYQKMRQVEDTHWWFVARRNIIAHVISSLDLHSNPEILDAGCGTGGNLDMLSRFGKVTGIEMDDQARSLANERGKGTVLPGHLPNGIPHTHGQFDLIVLLDVLEHIDSDAEALRSLADCLAPRGYLVVTVPAFPFLWSQHDSEHHHKRRYRKPELIEKINTAGLQIEKITYYNTILFPVVAAVRLLGSLVSNHKVGNDMTVPHPLVNKGLSLLFLSEKYLVNRTGFPFGVSLLAVARKV